MAQQPSSVLETLKALASKKPAPAGSSTAALNISDPAIAGAKRQGKSSTVVLGHDPKIAEDAAVCARLKEALEDAKAQFETYQSTLRDYGKEKRDKYNEAFKANVTTVCVPFTVEVPEDQNSDTPGRETRLVQVICSNRYSVAQDVVLANKESIGEQYQRLFTETETKVLKPNAEELIRGLLGELGVQGEELDNLMSTLLDTTVKVATAEGYEQEIKKAPEAVQTILGQAVTRVQPGLKFP